VTQPTDAFSAPQAGQTALSRDLSDFLVELSIAIHKHAMYPEGHPSLIPAADRVLQRLHPLLIKHGTLSLGVARNQLVIEGVATDAKNPVLMDLAGRLHRHELGAVTFKSGVDPLEVHSVLSTLAVESDRTGEPIGRGPASQLTQWANVTLYPVNFASLEIVGDAEASAGDEEEREGRSQAASLWVGLARAAMALEEGEEPASTEPGVVAEAIDKSEGGGAYDQVIVGYLLKIADELRTKKGGEALALKNRMSKLVQQLDGGTIQRLLSMGGDRTQRRQFLMNAAEGMAVDAVLELVKAASDEQEQTVSHSMLRMLTKMAQHAESGSGERQALADSAVREQITDLIKDWSLKDPNPDAYRQALQRMSMTGPMFAVSTQVRFQPEPKRMFEMALEVNEMGEGIERAVTELVNEGRLKYVTKSLNEAEAPAVTEPLWQALGSGSAFEDTLTAEPIDADALDLILSKVGAQATEPMLDVLAESESQQTRSVLIDRLAKLGPQVGPAAIRRLDDTRWFVQRNMLLILSQLPEVPGDLDAVAMLNHSDDRVRRVAVEVALKVPAARERAIATALADPEDRIVRIGLNAALESCPEAVLPLVVRTAVDGSTEEQRWIAVRVLAESRSKQALEALMRLAAPRRRWLKWKLPSKTKVFLAVLRALQSHRSDPRVKQVLAIAARSKDPAVAAAAKGGGEVDD
jgi:hypothetical protein